MTPSRKIASTNWIAPAATGLALMAFTGCDGAVESEPQLDTAPRSGAPSPQPGAALPAPDATGRVGEIDTAGPATGQ